MKLKIGLIVLLAALGLTSCGGQTLSGTYICDDPSPSIELGLTELTFTEDAVTGVQYDAFPFEEMDWEIKDGKLILSEIIEYQYVNPGAQEYVYEYDLEIKGNSIFLDGVEFKKAE